MNRDDMEARRFAVAKFLESGGAQAQIAERFGVSRNTAMRWTRRWKAEDMPKRPATGRKPSVPMDIWRAIYNSHPTWTCFSFADAVCLRTGVRFHHDHVGRMLRMLRAEPHRLTPQEQAVLGEIDHCKDMALGGVR